MENIKNSYEKSNLRKRVFYNAYYLNQRKGMFNYYNNYSNVNFYYFNLKPAIFINGNLLIQYKLRKFKSIYLKMYFSLLFSTSFLFLSSIVIEEKLFLNYMDEISPFTYYYYSKIIEYYEANPNKIKKDNFYTNILVKKNKIESLINQN